MPSAAEKLFLEKVAPILQRDCVHCHNSQQHEGGLNLDSLSGFQAGGDSGPVFDAAMPERSGLLQAVIPSGNEPPAMPKSRPALSQPEVQALREWLASAAAWPANHRLQPADAPLAQWWSLEPLANSVTPSLFGDSTWPRENFIDAYIQAALHQQQLQPALRATPRQLIRRVTFDLTGLPPEIDEVEQFVADQRPDAYERLVDRLLASPAYGQRWGRHWLDVVHFGETHGYDKDKLRLNAWPYRDYVIDSLNSDKPFTRFIEEQIAGDLLWPDDYQAITAVGFLSAGPWDFIGHAEVPESKLDGRIARHLDRDDMVQNTFLTFQSLTIGCAQCHNHKFDPITQEEYYGLQAVFAALDRADRKAYRDPRVQRQFRDMESQQRALAARETRLRSMQKELGGQPLAELDQQIAAAQTKSGSYPPEHGYHSAIEQAADHPKWVQIDLGTPMAIAQIQWIACHDDFAGIGAGFGAPPRWKIEAADDPEFVEPVQLLASQTTRTATQVGIEAQSHAVGDCTARYVRFTALELAPRQNDFIFALAELRVLDRAGVNLAINKSVTARDSIEAPIRWSVKNLVDDKYPQAQPNQKTLQQLQAAREQLLQERVPVEQREQLSQVTRELAQLRDRLKQLPPPEQVYVATIHYGSGAFSGTGPGGGQPRRVEVLPRGDVSRSGPAAVPQALSCLPGLPTQLAAVDSSDAQRRTALARWLSHSDNPLTWRSIANRIWSYHFQRGIVETPNDFGRMGALPSHPELLDRLALLVRDGQSLKQLHRAIVLSATYRQASQAQSHIVDQDPKNQWLARSPRRRLEAEAIRDCMLQVAGLLRREMGGPSYQDFVIEHPEHSPHYEYHLHDPRDAATMRRSIYRFIVRSQTQPLMTSLDCADPSMQVDVRNQSNSATQALSLLNNAFTLMAAEEWSELVQNQLNQQQQYQQPIATAAAIARMFVSALGRAPNSEELEMLVQLAQSQGVTAVARVIFNLNEFIYVD